MYLTLHFTRTEYLNSDPLSGHDTLDQKVLLRGQNSKETVNLFVSFVSLRARKDQRILGASVIEYLNYASLSGHDTLDQKVLLNATWT